MLATSDLHLHLCPWDYFADRPAPGRGLAAAAARILALRRELPNCLLLDNGDLLQGNPLGDALADARPPTAEHPHPMVQALNLLGCDAMGLGNHDFDFGLDFLGAALAGAEFPALCANLQRCDGGPPLFGGWTILERQVTDSRGKRRRLRIGVVGFAPPQVTVWADAALAGRISAQPILATAHRVVPRMIAAGAEVVIALCHSGIGRPAAQTDDDDEHVSLALAALPGIDAVIGGHSHEVFPGPLPPGLAAGTSDIDVANGRLAGKPACLPGFAASHLGILRLQLDFGSDRRWHCRGGSGAVQDLTLTDAAHGKIPAPFLALCEGANTTTRRHLDRAAGRSEVALTSFFAMAADCPATRMVARAMRWHVTNVLADGPHGNLPVLAAASPSRVGGRGGPTNFTELAPGDLRERDLAALFPFSDAIRALRLTGAELAEWQEHSAGSFLQLHMGARDAPLTDPGRPFYNFDLIEGLSYEIALDQPARYDAMGRLIAPMAQRIRDLRYAGAPLDPRAEFVLAATSFRAAGGGGYPGSARPDRLLLAAPTTVRSIVGAYLALEGPYQTSPGPGWRFSAMPGTTALLPTGPAASALLPQHGLEALAIGDDGFLQVRVTL